MVTEIEEARGTYTKTAQYFLRSFFFCLFVVFFLLFFVVFLFQIGFLFDTVVDGDELWPPIAISLL